MAEAILHRGRVVSAGPEGVRVELTGRDPGAATAPLQHLGPRPEVGEGVVVGRVGTWRDDLVVLGILGGRPALLLTETTAPADPAPGGGLLYVEDGHLHYLSPTDVDTQLDS